MTALINENGTAERSDISHFDMVYDVNNEIFRLDALLKAFRVVAYDLVEQKGSPFVVRPEDFPYLFDIAIDRLNLIKAHVDEIESNFRKLLEANHE